MTEQLLFDVTIKNVTDIEYGVWSAEYGTSSLFGLDADKHMFTIQ